MNTKYNIVIFLIFICFSCTDKKATLKANVIDLTDSYSNRKKVNLSTIAKNIEYIPLQSDSTSLLGRIREPYKNIQFKNNNIYITDLSGQLYLFHNTGAFLNKVGEIGRGPGEYVKCDIFTVLNEGNKNSIYVYSAGLQKTLVYNNKGEFIRDFDIKTYPHGLASTSRNLVFISPIGSRKRSDYYTLRAFSPEGTLLKRMLHKGNEAIVEKNQSLALNGMFNSYKHNDTLSFWETNYDTIWRISNEFEAVPKYIIDIGGNKMPLKERTEEGIFNFQNFVRYNTIQKLHESRGFLFFETLFENRLYSIFYDKRSKRSVSVEFDKPIGRGKHFSFYNDIDGGFPFWPMGKVADNKVFMVIQSNEFKDYINNIGEDNESKNKNARNRLLKLVQDVKYTDNPILMVVTLKNV